MTDFIEQTSTSTASPFTLATSGNFKEFSAFFDQDQRFTANFDDGTHNMVAICYLNGSGELVVDTVKSSTASTYAISAPTFSGTVTISIGVSSDNVFNYRSTNWQSDISNVWEDIILSADIESCTQNFTCTANRLTIFNYLLAVSGLFYAFGVRERAVTSGNYRLGLWELDGSNGPGSLIATTDSIAHGNANAQVQVSFTTAKSITSLTAANPVSVTATAHGKTTGDIVYITDVSGMTEVNHKLFIVTVTDADTFTLSDENGAVDGSGYSAGTGGIAHKPIVPLPGEYAAAYLTDAGVGFVGPTNSQKTGNGFMGHQTSLAQVTAIYGTYSYAALTDNPLSPGSLTRLNSGIATVGLLGCRL